jgi:hypothetical protein
VLGCVSVVLVKIGGVDGLTGYATLNTSEGYVNVTVAASTAVTLVTDTIAFSEGIVAVSGPTAVNTSVGTNPSSFGDPGPFRLRNDGNVYVNVTFKGSTPNGLLGVDGIVNYSFAIENFTTAANSENINNTCSNFDDGSPATEFWLYAETNESQPLGITMSNAYQMVCPNMSYADTNDEFNVSIFFNLTTDVGTNTTYADVVEFNIASHGHS